MPIASAESELSAVQREYDVVIASGGPAGSTLGTLLRKYDPSLRVLIVERDRFPRDHVGESQLPAVCEILDEMGVWDKVEAANFPIKIGATYRWGRTNDLWNFNFIQGAAFEDQVRPARYEGQRRQTAFQVDRSVYDKILLDHAREVGCTVVEGVKLARIEHQGDRVSSFELASPSETCRVQAEFYCDCTGVSGLLRRTMGVSIQSPTSLRNVAVWDYWQNAEWAVKLGVGGTRVQVLSLGWGWLWFIPVGKTRTSIGLVTAADYLKTSGKRLEELYRDAVEQDPLVSELTQGAICENRMETTKDWSYCSDRFSGANWFLAGDSAGFADPILAAGMTLAQSGARRLAYTILELKRGKLNPEWLRREYDSIYQFQIGHHIRFADYWYSSNEIFTDLKANCSKIAADAGLNLEPDAAFQWLGTGGFARDTTPGVARAAAWGLGTVKHLIDRFSDSRADWAISKSNRFVLNLEGGEKEYVALYLNGQISPTKCFQRGQRQLPLTGLYDLMFQVLCRESDLREIADIVWNVAQGKQFGDNPAFVFSSAIEVLEAMVCDGWVSASLDETRPLLSVRFAEDGYAMEFVES
jgi:flavin-dependent dehydrogenase